MASFAGVLLLFAVLVQCALGQTVAPDGSCDAASAQPVLTSIDPPAGTTRGISGESSNYTITGTLLDQIESILVLAYFVRMNETLQVTELARNSTMVMFQIQDALLRQNMINATVQLFPRDPDCVTLTVDIKLYPNVRLRLTLREAQPGTVLYIEGGTNCIPGECGDNSTTFSFMVGNVTLETLSTQDSSYVGRFPNFQHEDFDAPVRIVTQYQTFQIQFTTLTLRMAPPITGITPNRGQRGTRVTITGSSLIGPGLMVAISRVRLGDSDAEIIASSSMTIQVRAGSGTPGNGTVRINTTDTIQNIPYDGPYLTLIDGWSQLADGNITDIVPPAAQLGRNILICGIRLLGGGTSIVTIHHGASTQLQLLGTLRQSAPSEPGSECVDAMVPGSITMQNVSEGIITVTSDTGSTVVSASNFTISSIVSITPSRGQAGTIVTIRGQGLLSGYTNVTPTVFLSNTTVRPPIRSSNTEIVAETGTPTPFAHMVNSTQSLPTIFGVMGSIVIEVPNPLISGTYFDVFNETGWQYEISGNITEVSPGFGQVGTIISINGTNLLAYGNSLTHATINDTNAMIMGNATNSLVQLIVPDSNMTGPVDIILFSDTGASVRGPQSFEYRTRGAISSALPSQGQRGTRVTILGTNLFGHGRNVTSVSFGRVAATVDYASSNNTSIVVQVQANNNTMDANVTIQIIADTSAMVNSSAPIWTFLVQGQISTNEPREGQMGTRIEINGTNLLGGGMMVSQVFLDGVSGTIANQSNTRIVVIMGDLLTQRVGFFSGQIYIMSDTGAMVIGGSYTHRPSGMVTNVSPTRGRRGTFVTILGMNVLGFGTDLTGVEIAGVSSTVVSFNSTILIARAGMGPANQTGPVVLRSNTGAIITSFTNFTFDQPGIVSSVNTIRGAEGTGILISGSGLLPSNGQLTNVTVGGIPVARVVSASDQDVSFIVGPSPPSDISSNVSIVISASDGSFVDGIFFSFINLSISLPGLSRGQEGTNIDITLPNTSEFDPTGTLRATIGNQAATILNVNVTQRRLVVSVPRARALGTFTADVAVEGANGLIARLRDGFTYLAEGVICVVQPAVGQPGTRVTLQGENLIAGGTNITAVTVVDQPAMVVQSSNTMVVVELMAARQMITYPQRGSITLMVDTGAVVTKLDTFELITPGSIARVTPQMGQNGTRVEIAGANLVQGNLTVTSVSLAGVLAVITGTPTNALIRVEAANMSAQTQPLPVVITLSSGARIASGSGMTFRYLSSGQIISVQPNNGPVGTRVSIRGTNLLQGGTMVTLVTMAGVNATVNSASDTEIQVTAQTGVPGNGDVIVISDTGSTLTGRGLWTYQNLGSITSLSPSTGQQGFTVNITGVNLLSSASGFSSCALAGVLGEVVGRISGSAVTCRAGSITPSNRMNVTGPVQLITNTGVTITSPSNLTFTYYPAYIDSVSPSEGNNGTEVTIRGLNLFTYANSSFQLSRVLLGSVEAVVVNSSANEIFVRAGFLNTSGTNNSFPVRIESTSGSFLELANAWDYTAPAQIISISPQFGFPGEAITITGENLAQGANTPRVIVGQTQALDVTVLNDTIIEFQAGVYQNTDLPDRNLPLQIVYPTGESTVNSGVVFRYNQTFENVTSVIPRAGSEGSRIIISGINFPNSSAISSVTLAGVDADFISGEANQLVVDAGMPPPTSTELRGPVVIELMNGRVFGLGGDAWEYYPVITADDVSPIQGQNGTNVTIDLSRIPNLPSVMRVNLTSVPASIVGVTDGGMLTVRAGESGSTPLGDITVELADGIMITISSAWSYQVPVNVTQITPSTGYFNTLVTITGTGFQSGSVTVTSVLLAGFETAFVSQTNTQLMVRITQEESSLAGDVVAPVSITSSSGAFYSSSRQMNFTYVAVRFNNATPAVGTRGTEVVLTGVGLLGGGSRIVSATIAGTSASIRAANLTTVVLIAGPSAASSAPGNITYTMNTGAVLSFQRTWSYIEPGVITSVSPSAGSMGTVVSITGINLLGGGTRVIEVFLNSQRTMDILDSFDNFVQVMAAGSTGPLSAGSVRIISDTQAITESNSTVQFTYLAPGNISSILPSQGQDGTMVTITGQRFHNGEGVSRVLLAGVEARVRNMTETTITVEAGRSVATGSFQGPVTVMSNIGTTTISMQNFTYLTEGVIFTVAPDRGRNGSIVRISGENILGGGTALQSVILAGEPAQIVNQSSTEVYVRAPLGSSMSTSVPGDVLLVSNTNARVRRVDGWTYVQQGAITSISPQQGQFGTLVTISGQNLLSGGSGVSSLQFDNVSLEIETASDTRIVANVGQPANTDSFVSSSVTITSDFGGTLYLSYNWMFLNQSSITSLSPPNGFGMEMVTINGTDLLGGGTSIRSVIVADISGMVEMSSNDQVVITTGINTDGEARTGILVLESDTGALTMTTWNYDAECTNNTYGTIGNCLPCDEQCAGCNGPSDMDCIECANFAIPFPSDGNSTATMLCVQECPSVSTLDRVCVDVCESNQYEQIDTLQNLTFCYNCSSLCDPNLGCSGPSASQCRGCLFVRDAINQTCIEECPAETFYVNSTRDCVPCDPQCSMGCTGPSAADCVECANFGVYPTPAIMALTGSTLLTTVCRAACPDRFFISGQLCQPCDSNCRQGCSGPTPYDCDNCMGNYIIVDGREMCTPSCNISSSMQQYYQVANSLECRECHPYCLPGAGCSGPATSDCNLCSLNLGSVCVDECTDATYFIRNSTRQCIKCHESCGMAGCTEEGSGNCNTVRGPLYAGGGAIAIVIVIVLILVIVIVVLVVFLLLVLKGRKLQWRGFAPYSSGEVAGSGSESRYSTRPQTIALQSIETTKETANPVFQGEYSEMGHEQREDIEELYVDTEGQDGNLPEKVPLSASQDNLYTDMDNLPPAFNEPGEVTGSQDMLYTDMEPVRPEKGAEPVPALPPKPVDQGKQDEKPLPELPPKDGQLPADELPPLPSKPEKPAPPGPPPEDKEAKKPVEAEPSNPVAPELYTDMQGGITEVFINPSADADDVYDDVEPPTSNSPPPLPPSPLSDPTYEDTSPIIDDTYEDTDTVLESVEQYRRVNRSASNVPPRVPPALNKNRQSAPALPSQPIPKKRSAGALPQTPLQKSLSSSTVTSPTSPTSTIGSLPEEECLYDDIGGVQPLVTPPPVKTQPPKKQSKAKSKKK